MTNYAEYLDNLFRWKPGRQNPYYKKMFLLGNPFLLPFDIYLLKFETGADIQPHRDRVESGRHFRLNLVLRHAREGGVFSCQKTIHNSRSLKIFRPDLYEHAVSMVTSGTRYVLSVGWVLR